MEITEEGNYGDRDREGGSIGQQDVRGRKRRARKGGAEEPELGHQFVCVEKDKEK